MSSIKFFDGFDGVDYYANHSKWIYSASSSFDAVDQGGNGEGRIPQDSNYNRRAMIMGNTGFGRVGRNYDLTSSDIRVDCYIKFNNDPEFGNSEFLSFRRRRLDVSSGIEGNEPHSKSVAFAICKYGTTNKGFFQARLGNQKTGSSAGLDTGNFCGDEAGNGIDPDTNSLFLVDLNTWYHLQVHISGSPAGSWQFYIDGKLLMDGSFINLEWNRLSVRWECYGGFGVWFDDFILLEGAGDFPAGMTATTLYPTEDGTIQSWGKANVFGDPYQKHWSAVDDRYNTWQPNDYVYQDGVDSRATFGFNRAFPQGAIQSVQFVAITRLDPATTYNGASPSIKLVLERRDSGNVVLESPAFTVSRRSGSWWNTGTFFGQWYSHVWKLDEGPDGPWTEDEFVERRWKFGVRHLGAFGKVRVMQLYVERLHLWSGGSGSRYRLL